MNDIAKTYERLAEAYAEREASLLDKKPYDRARLDVVLGGCPAGRPILDVGCGPGQAARYLASKGAEVIGIDASSKMIELARSAGGTIEYRTGDLVDLDHAPGSVGGVVCFDSLIHIDKVTLRARLEAFGNMLAPGAAILFTMYQGDDQAPFEVVFGAESDALPATLYQRKELEALANGVGLFDVVRVEGRRPYQFERPWHRIFVTARRASP